MSRVSKQLGSTRTGTRPTRPKLQPGPVPARYMASCSMRSFRPFPHGQRRHASRRANPGTPRVPPVSTPEPHATPRQRLISSPYNRMFSPHSSLEAFPPFSHNARALALPQTEEPTRLSLPATSGLRFPIPRQKVLPTGGHLPFVAPYCVVHALSSG